ncbi:hypothetical protein D9619_010423 [Psilocybe cf. subviscida]|uniref:Uncharacterized protein n=1 Tax=Psilocybe cf. subviscida TaxID=2480587 RepID=A0A8H5ASD7_9AGAR|nr:hypothetical protein D9619_010423 [Psilocybe cf. subviscida]
MTAPGSGKVYKPPPVLITSSLKPPPAPPCLLKGAKHGGHHAPSCFALESNVAATLVSPRRLSVVVVSRSRPPLTLTPTPTRIASPFLETGSGRASLVADFGVIALAHYDPSYSEVVQRLPITTKCLRCSTITNHPLPGRHLHFDALTLSCIAGQLMRSGLGGPVLPLSHTHARVYWSRLTRPWRQLWR